MSMKRWTLWISIFWLSFSMTVYAQERPLNIKEQEMPIYYQNEQVKKDIYYDTENVFELVSKDKEIQVLVDDVNTKIEWKEDKGIISFSKQKHHVQIIKEQQVIKDFWIYGLDPVRANAQFVLTGDGKHSLKISFDTPCIDEIYAVIQINDQVVEEIQCIHQKEVSYVLTDGEYKVYLKDHQNLNRVLTINEKEFLNFHFSDQEPQIQTELKEISGSKNKELLITWPDFLKDKSVMINQNTIQEHNQILLESVKGQEKLYHIELEAIDIFERHIAQQMDVLIDDKAPILTLYHGSQPMLEDHVYMIADKKDFTFFWNEAVQQQVQVFVNDQEIKDPKLNEIWHALKRFDRLKLICQGKDNQGNVSIYTYIFQYQPKIENTLLQVLTVRQEPEKVVHVQTKDPYFGSYLDSRSIWRTWKKNSDQKIVLDKKEIHFQDKTKPSMRFVLEKGTSLLHLKKGDSIRLTLLNTEDYSKDHFIQIKVNGKEISRDKIQKDVLNNEYITIVLDKKETTIWAKAKDVNGNTSHIKQTFSITDSNFDRYEIPVILIMLLVIGVIWKLRNGKVKNSQSKPT